jgi:hypothetical protein
MKTMINQLMQLDNCLNPSFGIHLNVYSMKKKLFITCAAILTAVSAQSQTPSWQSSGNDLLSDPMATTQVGIAVPQTEGGDRLTVGGNIGFGFTTGAMRHIWGRSPNYGLAMFSGTNWNDGAAVLLGGHDYAGGKGDVTISAAQESNGINGGSVFFRRWGTGGWATNMTIAPSGNVGIADDAPNDKLTVNGNIGFSIPSTGFRHIWGRSSGYGLAIYSANDWNDGAGILLGGKHNATGNGDVIISAADDGNGWGGSVFFKRWSISNNWVTNMVIDKDGKVIIGDVPNTNTAHTYGLYVEKGVITSRVKVALTNDPTNWSDFVFADDYQLRSLNEVEDFIKENKHLPEIPSTEEVHKEGLDLAQMDAKLLQKVEELTLYIIQQQKEIDELKSKMK